MVSTLVRSDHSGTFIGDSYVSPLLPTATHLLDVFLPLSLMDISHEAIQYVVSWFFPHLQSMIFLRFIHTAACVHGLFFYC